MIRAPLMEYIILYWPCRYIKLKWWYKLKLLTNIMGWGKHPCRMEDSDATQKAPSITDATYSVTRELRESQGSNSGTWTHEPSDYMLLQQRKQNRRMAECCPLSSVQWMDVATPVTSTNFKIFLKKDIQRYWIFLNQSWDRSVMDLFQQIFKFPWFEVCKLNSLWV